MGFCFQDSAQRGHRVQPRWRYLKEVWISDSFFSLNRKPFYEIYQRHFYELQLVTFFSLYISAMLFPPEKVLQTNFTYMLLDTEVPCWICVRHIRIWSRNCGSHYRSNWIHKRCYRLRYTVCILHIFAASGRSPWSATKPCMMISCLCNWFDS